MALEDEIRQYYFDNLGKLSKSNQFHFASRIAAWEGSDVADKCLRELRNFMIPTDMNTELSEILKKTWVNAYASKLRYSLLKKYPDLYGITCALFRVRHLKEIYNVDVRQDFIKLVNLSELEELQRELLNDKKALRILSTLAVNFLYLKEILLDESDNLDPTTFKDQKESYDLNDSVQTNLYVYLIAHCIIAESNYYSRNVPPKRLPVYKEMLEELVPIIKKNHGIRIDSKFEFLVSARICGIDSPLSVQIDKHAKLSLSSNGKYITEKLVDSSKQLNSFDGSEHRNVLYIMSKTPFMPRKISI